MSKYVRFFNAVFARGLDLPSGARVAKWIVSPYVPAPTDNPDTPLDESSTGLPDDPNTQIDESKIQPVPEVAKYFKPIERRALSLVAARAGVTEY